MKRVKTTALYKEKRKILYTYLALVIPILVFMIVLAVKWGPPIWFYGYFSAFLLILTFFFAVSYRNPAAWGWMMYGRSRHFSGTPWQSRLDRNLTHMDARKAAEEQMEYEEALYHERPDSLTDMRHLREDMKERRKIDMPRSDPSKSRLAEGVLKCPQCDTPYVFDRDNPICKRCGTRLHRGRAPSG